MNLQIILDNGIDKSQIEKDPEFKQDYYPFFYKGLRVEQNQNIFAALDKTMEIFRPEKIFEIGYRRGGFTKILDDHYISDNAEIWAYDKIATESAKLSPRVERIHGDAFKMIGEIGEKIQSRGKSMVFCDGGDKNAEFRLLAPYLKEGDVILTHDYAPNEKIWREEYLGKKWDWFESWDGELDNTCRQYNLVNFLAEYWNPAVWSCKRKYNESI